jgi:Uma2 family endonuclease
MPTSPEGMTMMTTPATAAPPANHAIPSLDELYQMRPDVPRVFRGVDWDCYERFLDLVGDRPGFRMAFDGRDLEIMVTGPLHEDIAEFAGRLIELITEELVIPARSMARTIWKRIAVARGLEADQSYYFSPQKLAQAAAARRRNSNDVEDYPNPDLAIEINISTPDVDRQGIYKALRVSEVWRFNDTGVTIERLDDSEAFVAVDSSGYLPIRSEEIARWVFQEETSDLTAWKRRLRDWIRDELMGRRRVQ